MVRWARECLFFPVDLFLYSPPYCSTFLSVHSSFGGKVGEMSFCLGTKVPRHSAGVLYACMSSKARASNHVTIHTMLLFTTFDLHFDVMIATFRQALPQPSNSILRYARPCVCSSDPCGCTPDSECW